MNRLKLTCLLLLIAMLAAPCPVRAREVLMLTGAEGGDGKSYNYFAFLAAVMPVFKDKLGSGLVQKYWVDYFGYNYQAGDRTIDATGFGVEAAAGWQGSGEHGWWGLYLGARYSDTFLSPDNPSSSVRGNQVRPTMQLEGEGILSRDWRIGAIGRYIPVSDSYWSRARVMYRLSREIYTGPEFIAHGDPDYRTFQGGWFVTGFQPYPKSGLGFKLGVRKTAGQTVGEYFGVEFSRIF